MATIGYVQQITFMKIIYSISAWRRWFSSAKMIIITIKLTKNLPINSPVQRKIPAKNVSVDCIHINGLSTACQSEGKVLLPVKTKNRVFSAIILYFSVIFFIDERLYLEQFIYQKIKISRKWSVWRCTVTITAMINHGFIFFSAVQIYDLSYIHLHQIQFSNN